MYFKIFKIWFGSAVITFLPFLVFAHEGEEEGLVAAAEDGWVAPFIAGLVVIATIVVVLKIRKK